MSDIRIGSEAEARASLSHRGDLASARGRDYVPVTPRHDSAEVGEHRRNRTCSLAIVAQIRWSTGRTFANLKTMGGMRAASGSRLGQYELGERLGNGGMAEVFVARVNGAHGFAKKVAIKRILPQLARDPRFVAMFCDEARICAALSHPNVVQVIDFGEHDGDLFMAMEFVDGLSAAKLLRAVAAKGLRFPLAAAFYVAHEVLRGLAFVHDARDEHGRPLGLVHRDVSPGNILIGKTGEVKLTDFGIVRSEFVARRTYPGELKGKLGYMSPEQVMGEEVSPRSDLFTIGIVLAEMLLTRPMFGGSNEVEILTRIHEADLRMLREHGGHLPPVVQELLHTAMARDPTRRFQSAADFADALRSAANDCGIAIADDEFMPWLWSLGLFPSHSGTREAVLVKSERKSRRPLLSTAPPSSRSLPPSVPTAARVTVRPPRRERAQPPVVSYQVLTRQGAMLGPLKLPELVELVLTGRIGMDAMLSEDGLSFRALATVKALAPYVEHPGYRFGETPENPAWHRPLDRTNLPAILYGLCRARESGVLIARQGRREKRLFFLAGEPRFIASTDRNELIGARLVQARLATQQQVDQGLVAAGLRGDSRLGECLVAAKIIDPKDLVRALVDQLESAFSELLTWSSGELWFVRGVSCPDEVPRAARTGSELVTRAVRDAYAASELAAILGNVRSVPLSGTEDDGSELGLTARETLAFERARLGITLERLIAKLEVDAALRTDEVLLSVYVALSAGALLAPGFSRGAP